MKKKALVIVFIIFFPIGALAANMIPPIFDNGTWCSRVVNGDVLDAEGIPTHLPSQALSIMERNGAAVLGCTPIAIADMAPHDVCYNLLEARNYKLKGVAWSVTDCTGERSEESVDTAPVWLTPGEKPGKPSLQ